MAEHFKSESESQGESVLADFDFTVEDVEKACSEQKTSSAPGPDGVPAALLKECRKQLVIV